jgi:hypothetical protein
METTTIIAIRDLLSQVQENFDAYQQYHKDNNTDMDACSYGSENEYCIKSIVAGIKNILTDLGYLTRSHNLFLKLSTYSNRTEIQNRLRDLSSHLRNRQTSNIVSDIEWLKNHLRTYCLRLDRNRYLDFNSEIDELRRKAILLEDEIKKTQQRLSNAATSYSEIESKQDEYNTIIAELNSTKDSFVEEVNTFTAEFGEFKELTKKAKNNETEIATSLETANKDLEKFNEFIAKISEREQILTKQAESTTAYELKLNEYTQEHAAKLEEAKQLIDDAKTALHYKNAEGLSAAFSHQLDTANNKHARLWWLGGAIIFILATLSIGIWIVTGWGISDSADQNQMILNLVGRLSMIPFTIVGAIFCANQYTKQKYIIEDYAYKTTTAKSIIAFSEELRDKDSEKYAEYISTILKEIHQDPLRKRGKNKENFTLNKDTTGLIEKIIALLQSTINK